jgi:hypothetical protein
VRIESISHQMPDPGQGVVAHSDCLLHDDADESAQGSDNNDEKNHEGERGRD